MYWTGGDAVGHAGVFLEPARPGHRGDVGIGQPTPPTVTSVRHAGAMAGFEQDTSAHRAMHKGGAEKETATGSGGREGSHIQGLQHVWIPPGYGDLFLILGAGDLSSRQ